MAVGVRTYQVTDRPRFGTGSLIVAAVGLVGTIAAYLANHDRFFHAYLTGIAFWMAICLGSLFFVMLHHLTGAKWSIVIRRIPETLIRCLPVMALLSIPVFFGMHSLYHWSHEEAVATDSLLQSKEGFLNFPFFIVRGIIYFGIWSALGYYLYKYSVEQDKGYTDDGVTKLRRISAGGMVVFALSLTMFAYDWLMSLDPHWYSTIFGVYYFSGSVWVTLGLFALLFLYLQRTDALRGILSTEHLHDIGKLAFAFTVFWTYIAFSQFFLIWYGNVPEETAWFLRRWEGGWREVSLYAIIFGHFVIPFFVLIFRAVKRSNMMMRIMGVWLLIMHWFDMYWLVYPSFLPEGANFSWIDVMPTLFIGGVLMFSFWRLYSRNSALPVNDPKLEASIEFANY